MATRKEGGLSPFTFILKAADNILYRSERKMVKVDFDVIVIA